MGTWCTLGVEEQRRRQELLAILEYQQKHIRGLEERLKERVAVEPLVEEQK